MVTEDLKNAIKKQGMNVITCTFAKVCQQIGIKIERIMVKIFFQKEVYTNNESRVLDLLFKANSLSQ